MTGADRRQPPEPAELPRALAAYAEQLLLGTALSVADAVDLASRRVEGPAEVRGLAEALRAGWNLDEEESSSA